MSKRALAPLIVVCALVASAVPAGADAQRYIINGRVSDPEAWPSYVFLSMGCGGTLVAPEWVLTASHCIVDERGDLTPAGEVTAVVGRTDHTAEDGEEFGVAELVPHPGYDTTLTLNDVALVRLDAPSSAPLQALDDGSADLTAPGTVATVIGTGSTTPDGETPSNELREVEVTVRSDEDCGAYSGYDPEIMLCAGDPGASEEEPGRDSCQGDSGGPLFADDGGTFVQVGVVSFGNVCGVEDPGVYARLSTFMPWVTGVIEGTIDPGAPDPENPDPSDEGATSEIIRIDAGLPVTDPVEQAVAVSQALFQVGDADTVVIARADDYADALGGSTLGFGTGPLLFATAEGLPPATAAEVERVLDGGELVYVLGGPNAVPESVDAELAARGFQPVRLRGGSREDTAVVVADEVAETILEGVVDTVIVATRGNWPDAVAAGQLGAYWGFPVLLTPPDQLHPSTQAALQRYAPGTVYVVGGQGVVSDAVAGQIEATTGPGTVVRLSGPTRTGTAAAVLQENLALHEANSAPEDELPSYAVAVNLRRADAFAHVLSASMIAGQGAVFVALEGEDGSTLTPDVAAAACGLNLPLLVAGGPDLVSDAGAAAVQAALAGAAC